MTDVDPTQVGNDIASLRQRADQATQHEATIATQNRMIAFLQAGVDLTSPNGKLLMRGYDGPVTMEPADLGAITQAAKEINALRIAAALDTAQTGAPGTPTPATAVEAGAAEGQPVSDLAHLAATRAALSAEGMPAGVVGQEKLHPAAIAQLAFREKTMSGMDDRSAQAQAAQAYVGAFMLDGPYQDSVAWNGWTAEQLQQDRSEAQEFQRSRARVVDFGPAFPVLGPSDTVREAPVVAGKGKA